MTAAVAAPPIDKAIRRAINVTPIKATLAKKIRNDRRRARKREAITHHQHGWNT